MASIVLGPETDGDGSVTNTSPPADDDTAPRPACYARSGHYQVTFTKKSFPLRTTIYKWTHRSHYCRDGEKVRSLSRRTDWVSSAQWIVNVQGVTGNWTSGVGTAKATSFRQRKIELCAVRIACYATLYPSSRLYVRGNGNHSYSGTAG